MDTKNGGTGGYSEGGGASFIAAKALGDVGVTIDMVMAGAPLTKVGETLAYSFNRTLSGDEINPFFPAVVASGAVSFSSTNPDLVNTDKGQDVLSADYQDSSNFFSDARAWVNSEQTVLGFIGLVQSATQGDPTALLTPSVLAMMEVRIYLRILVL